MLISVALPIILAVIMFSLGLGLRPADFTRVISQPLGFGIGFFNQVILLPLVAFLLAMLFGAAFGLSGQLAFGVMILAACPGGVTSNVLTKLAKGNVALSVSLTAVISLVAVVSVPLILAFSSHHLMGNDAPSINILSTGLSMFVITALPVGLGVLLRVILPTFADRIEPILSIIAMLFFVLLVAAVLLRYWDVFISNLPLLAPILICLNAAMLLIGFVSATSLGLSAKDATTVALESGVQNATVGITIAGLIVANSSEVLGPFAIPVAVYGITMYLVAAPFVLWRRRSAKT